MCAGLSSPTHGTLRIDVDRGDLGYLGHDPLLYRDLTARENLELFARLYRVPARDARIRDLLERFGMWEERDNRVATYSRGMTQRVALCRVLLHDPRLLVLDEPYTALDAAGSELLDAELAARRGDHTFLVSTHDPARIEHLASSRLEFE
jgi:ABC-type multidrug transport system ATPase subunit